MIGVAAHCNSQRRHNSQQGIVADVLRQVRGCSGEGYSGMGIKQSIKLPTVDGTIHVALTQHVQKRKDLHRVVLTKANTK